MIFDRHNEYAVLLCNKYEDGVEASSTTEIYDTDPCQAWSVAMRSMEAGGNAMNSSVEKMIGISRAPELDSYHGESETRMQYQTYMCIPRNVSSADIICVQDTPDSDNVALAILSHATGGTPIYNTFIKVYGKHIDIKALLSGLERCTLDPLAMVRLFCISGNDYNHSCNVATVDRLVRSYVKWHHIIGDLNTPESFKALFYFSFVRATYPDGSIPSELSQYTTMSKDWRQKAREYIVCHQSATSSADVLPQDCDIEMVYRRAVVFNVNLYWKKAIERDASYRYSVTRIVDIIRMEPC